jgi:hypothetical protein
LEKVFKKKKKKKWRLGREDLAMDLGAGGTDRNIVFCIAFSILKLVEIYF